MPGLRTKKIERAYSGNVPKADSCRTFRPYLRNTTPLRLISPEIFGRITLAFVANPLPNHGAMPGNIRGLSEGQKQVPRHIGPRS